MSEAKFWQRIKKHKGLHWEILSDKFGTGIPDRIFVNKNGTVGLVELKFTKTIDLSTIERLGRDLYRASQSQWLNRFKNASGHPFLWIGSPSDDTILVKSHFLELYLNGFSSVPHERLSISETIAYFKDL